MTTHPQRYQIRDHDLPDRPPMATAGDYLAAVAEVERLHEEFLDQLYANGEGGNSLWQTLRVDELQPGLPPQKRYLSTTNGVY